MQTLQYKDDEYFLDGVQQVWCAPNGQWVDPFPQCIPNTYCKSLANFSSDTNLRISYETVVNGKEGDVFIPNDMSANFSCSKTSNTDLVDYKLGANVTKHNNDSQYELKGLSRVVCNNSEWVGLTRDTSPRCVKTQATLATITTLETNLSISKTVIILLAVVLIVCLLIIIGLVVFSLKVHKKRQQLKSKRINGMGCENGMNDYEDYTGADDYDDSGVEGEEVYDECKETKNVYEMPNYNNYYVDQHSYERPNSSYQNKRHQTYLEVTESTYIDMNYVKNRNK